MKRAATWISLAGVLALAAMAGYLASKGPERHTSTTAPPDPPAPAASTPPDGGRARPAGGAEQGAASAPSRATLPPVAAAAADADYYDDDDGWFDSNGEPTPAFLRAALEEAIAEHFPDRPLDPAGLERLTAATGELRRAQQALRALPYEARFAAERRALLQRVEDAGEAFQDVLQMSAGEFTARVAPDAGVDGDVGVDEGVGAGGGVEVGIDPDAVPASPEFLPPR